MLSNQTRHPKPTLSQRLIVCSMQKLSKSESEQFLSQCTHTTDCAALTIHNTTDMTKAFNHWIHVHVTHVTSMHVYQVNPANEHLQTTPLKLIQYTHKKFMRKQMSRLQQHLSCPQHPARTTKISKIAEILRPHRQIALGCRLRRLSL